MKHRGIDFDAEEAAPHGLASTALRSTGKQTVPRNGADFPTLKERIEVFASA